MSTISNKNKNRKKNVSNRLDEFEEIAIRLDEIARRHLPDQVIHQGLLAGCEAEIRQDALILAIEGYLEGNHGFRDAVIKQDHTAIQSAMERCVAITLRLAKRRLASRLSLFRAKGCQLTRLDFGSVDHPSQRHPTDLSADSKSHLINKAVSRAVSMGKLSPVNAYIVHLVCEKGMCVEDVAKAAKVSRSAVYQQIKRVRIVIPEIMESVEIHHF